MRPNDPLERSRNRNIELSRRRVMESFSSFAHVFKCELCQQTRPDEMRREPDSEICIKCVEDAGFEEP